MDEVIGVRSFSDMHFSGAQFQAAAGRMEQRLEDLMRQVGNMKWDSQAREAYQAIQIRFNNAYTDLKSILNELGGSVGDVATNHEDTERYLSSNVWQG